MLPTAGWPVPWGFFACGGQLPPPFPRRRPRSFVPDEQHRALFPAAGPGGVASRRRLRNAARARPESRRGARVGE